MAAEAKMNMAQDEVWSERRLFELDGYRRCSFRDHSWFLVVRGDTGGNEVAPVVRIGVLVSREGQSCYRSWAGRRE